MIEVDISKLEEVVNEYEYVLKQVKENNDRIIQEFQDLSKNWQDNHQARLTIDFNLERQRILTLEGNIEDTLKIYKELETRYKEIGKKIKYNLGNKELIKSKLEIILNQIRNILYKYNNLGDISFYPKAYIIRNQKKQLEDTKRILEDIKKSLETHFEKIEEIEKTIEDRIKTIQIEKFVLNHYEKEE